MRPCIETAAKYKDNGDEKRKHNSDKQTLKKPVGRLKTRDKDQIWISRESVTSEIVRVLEATRNENHFCQHQNEPKRSPGKVKQSPERVKQSPERA